MFQWIKKNRAKSRLKMWRRQNPPQNLNEDGSVKIDESHVICFVNGEYPFEHQILGAVDAASQWFFIYGSSQQAREWSGRKSDPKIYDIPTAFELHRISQHPFAPNKTVSHFAGELIAVCIGPVWNSRLTEYNRMYKSIKY